MQDATIAATVKPPAPPDDASDDELIPAVTANNSHPRPAFLVEEEAPRRRSLQDEVAALKGIAPQRIGTLECDSKFSISAVDEAAERLLGYDNNELIGKPITILMSPLVGRIHQGLFARIRKAPQAQVGHDSPTLLLCEDPNAPLLLQFPLLPCFKD